MDFQRKKAWAGRAFVLPWVIGAIVFFFIPLGQSLYYTFNELIFTENGMQLTPVGINNYTYAFLQDPYFLSYILESLRNMLISLPLIILFSLFAAVLLNLPLKGRGLIRALSQVWGNRAKPKY